MKVFLVVLLICGSGLFPILTSAYPVIQDSHQFQPLDAGDPVGRALITALQTQQGFEEASLEVLPAGRGEWFVHAANSLFHATRRGQTYRVRRLTGEHLSPVEIVQAVANPSTSQCEGYLLKYRNMKQGIITETYAWLDSTPGSPFRSDDFQELQGFQRDEGEDCSNGLDSGETVVEARFIPGSVGLNDRLFFAVKEMDYRSGKRFWTYRSFVRQGRRFVPSIPVSQKR